MAENQTINPAPTGPQAEEGANLDMARVPRNQGSDPKKLRAIILGQGFVVNGRQIIVHRITDKVRAKSKVVIEGFHLNAYNKVQLGVGQNWFNPVDFKKAYGDSEPISFLIPNFSRSLKDGDHIFVRLLSASYPVANGFITKYLIYSTKTEEEEAAEAGEKAGKSGQGKAGEGGAGGPTEIATGAMGAVLGGITGALFKSKEEEKKFEPQRVASRELASEGLNVSKEDADYDASEPIKAEEAVETSEIPVSGTAEISTGAQVIGQGTTGIAQTISQGGTISGQRTVTVSQEGTQGISGQQTVSASGTVSGGQKISVQGTVSGQERGETTGTVSVKQQAGVSGAASVQERTEVSGKESVRQETREPEGAPATAGEQTQATITASQAGEAQGKISEISEGKAGIQGQRQVATGGTAGIGAKADVGPSGATQAFQPASRDLRQTGTRGPGFGFTGASGARASAFGQTSRTSISPQVTQGGAAEVSSQISATKVGPKGAAVGAEEISQIGEEVLPQEEIKEPASSQIEIGIPPEEGQPTEQVQPQTNVEISLPEERAAGEPGEPGEMEEKIKVPKEYQEMIGKLGKGGADLERNVQGKSPEEGGFPKEAGEEEAGEEEPSKEGQEPEEGGIGKPLEYPIKEEPGGEEKPEKTPPSVKGEAPSEKASKVDGIQRPKEGLGPKEGLPPDLGQEAPEKGAGEPLAGEVPKAGLPAAGAAAPAAEAAEAGAAAAPLAEGATAGAAGGPMGMAAGAALAAAGSKGGLDAVASQAASPFLEQAALWVWGFAIPSFGLSVLLGSVVGDFIWIFKKKILNFRIKLHIVGMNLAVVLVAMILVLFFAVTMKYMCMNPLTYGTIWVSGNSDICKALEATTVQTLFSEPPALLPPGTPCAPLFSGDASVNNLANSCFGGNSTKASAIAGAESGGIPTSESRTDRCTLDNKSVSIGLFQINISVRSVNGLDCKKAFSHPYDAQHKDCQVVNEGLYSQCVAAAKNSLVNINLACQISGNGANWSAWGANRKCGF